MSPRDPGLRDLIGPFVLGACSPSEEADVRARMVVDADFRRDVESYSAVLDALMSVPVPDADPEPAGKARVMDVVRREADLFVAAGWAEPAAERSPSWRGRVQRALEPFRRPWAAAMLATVLVAVTVAGVAVGLGSGGGSSDDPGGPVVVGRALGDAAPRGHGQIVVDGDGDGGELRVSGFPAAGAGREYQVWIRSGQGDPRPTKVRFDVDRDGNGRAAIPAQAMEGTDEVLLTSEPDGGSPTPTRDPVLQVVMPA